jgi:hypothetical protein
MKITREGCMVLCYPYADKPERPAMVARIVHATDGSGIRALPEAQAIQMVDETLGLFGELEKARAEIERLNGLRSKAQKDKLAMAQKLESYRKVSDALIVAYSVDDGESIEWEKLDHAHELAKKAVALG